jgi:hypothetical protein
MLANKWPSAGIISAEAGSVFGGHTVGGDKIMRNLALQNVLWDGGSHPVGRRTSECFEVHGARLTIGLQAQESVLREFCNQYGSLAVASASLHDFSLLDQSRCRVSGSYPRCRRKNHLPPGFLTVAYPSL